MTCVHGRPAGAFCPHCAGVARTYSAETVVVPPYTFRPFEPIDSTIHPVVISSEGLSAVVVPVGVLPGLSWAPPPAVSVRVEAARGSTLGVAPAIWGRS